MTVAVGTAKPAGLRRSPGSPACTRSSCPSRSSTAQADRVERPGPARASPPSSGRHAPDPPRPAGSTPARPIHGSQDAWAKGYTGDGVRYMSNDSGADYCHPDLFGTWAYIDDRRRPTTACPRCSTRSRASSRRNDFYLGTHASSRDGVADYADTSTEVAFTPNQHGRPPGAVPAARGEEREDVQAAVDLEERRVPHRLAPGQTASASVADVISKAFFKGAREGACRSSAPASSSSTSRTAGVYDTVYVDLNYDYDFRNDAPARLTRDFTSQEAACLDYDQDGLNDISGGLVYFVSDGATPVPTQDWLWGFDGSGLRQRRPRRVPRAGLPRGRRPRPGDDVGRDRPGRRRGQRLLRARRAAGGRRAGPRRRAGQGRPHRPRTATSTLAVHRGRRSSSRASATTAQPGTGDDIQIVSNSWAFSDVDNDGVDALQPPDRPDPRRTGPTRTLAVRHRQRRTRLRHRDAGQPGDGHRTSARPTSTTRTARSSPTSLESQIIGGDVTAFSNRGPTPRNLPAPT